MPAQRCPRAVRHVEWHARAPENAAGGATDPPDGRCGTMPRARWFVVGFLLVAAVVGGVLNERGPFGAHSALAYDQFLADFQAGKVEQIVQWRDQLEVTEQGAMLSVVVPPERDLRADLGQA